MATATSDLERAETLEELYPTLTARSIGAGWNKPTPSLYPEPKKNFVPTMWRWSEGRSALDAAGRLISTDLAERRNLILYNPVEGNTYATVRTMICAYQMILPGETARSHRHTPNALRLVLEGDGAYTIVDGERLEMRPNDVLLTPNWHWHGHGSEGSGPCYWLDCLDVPLAHLIEPIFLEPHPAGFETDATRPSSSPYIFTWEDTQRRLDRTSPDSAGRVGRRIALGDPAMETIALYMQRMDAGTETRVYRTTANQIFCPVEGSGETVIDGESFAWSRGDVVAIPAWRPFTHQVRSDATLFVMTDEPLLGKLGWLRTQDG